MGTMTPSGFTPFETSVDYKPLQNGNHGPNTGGMGCMSPSPFINNALIENISSDVINPTIEGLKKLDTFERSEVIRLWLDMELVTTPNHSQMKEIEKSFFQSRQDANPVIKFERSDRQRVGVILKKINNILVMEKYDE